MTAQVGETLILDGEKTSMAFCPPLPDQHPRIIKLEDKDIKYDTPLIGSTACWRGYIGTWEIENGQFYLVDIVGRYKMVGQDPIFADWFSGVIRIPKGKLLHYVHMGFGSVYEQDIHVKIENGKVVESSISSNTKSQDQKTILVVDDARSVREILLLNLIQEGYMVETATDGQEAKDKLLSGLNVSLVISDIDMPRVNGLELLTWLKSQLELSKIPVVMLASKNSQIHQSRAQSMGADAFFLKPHIDQILLDKIAELLA